MGFTLLNKEKKLSAISRILFPVQVHRTGGRHLSGRNITAAILLPTLPCSALRRK